MSHAGERIQPVDFRSALRQALEHAAAIDTNNPLGNPEYSEFADKPDDHIIVLLLITGPDVVFTDDETRYRTLLRQAVGVQTGSSDMADEELPWVEQAAEHELAHGCETAKWSNNETSSYYGVKFAIGEDGRLLVWPMHAISGVLKKIHAAAISIAPEDRSPTDISIVRQLGYEVDDIDSIPDRAAAEPRVVDDLLGQTLKARLLEALGDHAISEGPQ